MLMLRLSAILLSFHALTLLGQNLIVNPGLEQIDTSYHLPGLSVDSFDVHNVIGWFSPGYGTSDYYNSDGKHSHFGSRIFSNETKSHSGVGHAGFFVGNSKWREFVGVNLSQSLLAGQHYRISMWLYISSRSKFAFNSLEIQFWDTSYVKLITDTNCYPPRNHRFTSVLLDSTNQKNMFGKWIQITEDFTAAGGEKSFVIGHFNEPYRTTSMPANSKNQTNEGICYYFIDDLTLVPVYYSGDKLNYKAPVVFFESGQSSISSAFYPALDTLALYLQDNQELTITINAYTDSVGTVANNLALSLKRAEASKEYLIKRGIAASRIKTVALAEARPKNESSILSRRVEFELMR